MNVVSLLPSATEIVCALGLQDHLAGRSHECDYPTAVHNLPAVTRPSFPQQKSSEKIDQSIKSLLKNGLSPFEADPDLLKKLNPDIILTQDHCEVCAISKDQLNSAAGEFLENQNVNVLSLSPASIQEILDSILKVGDQLNASNKALALVTELKERLNIIRQTTLGEAEKSVVAIEWISPMMCAGNWVPELISLAGGDDLLGIPGSHSPWIDPGQLLDADPDVILIMPCGYDISATIAELNILRDLPGWDDLKAVNHGEVYILDGNQYFNRPGPRIYDSARIIAEILHPELFRQLFHGTGWISLQEAVKE
ncbi:MAG: cobalamin-binding protein [Balneolaceae bacterium]|nr:cobalamin-binding protein [Balneolaceae bacterium]